MAKKKRKQATLADMEAMVSGKKKPVESYGIYKAAQKKKKK
jgi:hypothetical protein